MRWLPVTDVLDAELHGWMIGSGALDHRIGGVEPENEGTAETVGQDSGQTASSTSEIHHDPCIDIGDPSEEFETGPSSVLGEPEVLGRVPRHATQRPMPRPMISFMISVVPP